MDVGRDVTDVHARDARGVSMPMNTPLPVAAGWFLRLALAASIVKQYPYRVYSYSEESPSVVVPGRLRIRR
jgi:hypothetical protein